MLFRSFEFSFVDDVSVATQSGITGPDTCLCVLAASSDRDHGGPRVSVCASWPGMGGVSLARGGVEDIKPIGARLHVCTTLQQTAEEQKSLIGVAAPPNIVGEAQGRLPCGVWCLTLWLWV